MHRRESCLICMTRARGRTSALTIFTSQRQSNTVAHDEPTFTPARRVECTFLPHAYRVSRAHPRPTDSHASFTRSDDLPPRLLRWRSRRDGPSQPPLDEEALVPAAVVR